MPGIGEAERITQNHFSKHLCIAGSFGSICVNGVGSYNGCRIGECYYTN